MKLKAFSSFFLALAALMAAMTIAASAQTPPLVAAWQFDSGTGTTAVGSGDGNNGTLMGSAGWGAGATGAHALHLTGAPSGYVDIPKPVVDTTQSYTVTADVKMEHAAGWQTFVSIDGDQVSGFFLQLRGDTGEFAFTTLSRDDSGRDTVTAGSQVDPIEDVWYHLAGVCDASSKTLALYVNGVLQKSVPYDTNWRATGHTIIGHGKYGGNPVDFANGEIDNVRFYASALTAADIQALYAEDLPVAARPQSIPPGQAAPMTIDAGHPGVAVSPSQHGLMTEEINHSYDGGLYGELIQNRVFKDDDASPVHWSIVQEGGGAGTISLDKTQPLSSALPVSLKLDATTAGERIGAANDGYWGIPVKPNTTYKASFYAKAAPGFSGPLSVDIESTDGAKVYARGTIPKITGDWRQYKVTLKTGNVVPTEDARFVVSTKRAGTVWLNLVSLFPPTYHNRANGNRIDIMQKLAALKPTFLRFPGGNYLEGDTIATRFDWKKTLGPLTDRPGHEGPWSYRSTDGIGLLEFLEWCEDLHMEPLLAVYAGYSLNH